MGHGRRSSCAGPHLPEPRQTAREADEIADRLTPPALPDQPMGVDRLARHVAASREMPAVVPAHATDRTPEAAVLELEGGGRLAAEAVAHEKPGRREPLGQHPM